jgi:aminoglycoside phosphotransferase (APT) family kinase protein
MEVYPYPKDPWLPGLETAADPQVIAEAVARNLPLCQSGSVRLLRVRVTPQRYRPGRRLTLRLDILFRDKERGESLREEIFTRTYFAKVYHDPKKARSVFQEMQMLAQIPAARERRVVLAGAAAYLPELSMILQEPVGGAPLEDQVGRLIEGRTLAQDFRTELETLGKSPAIADDLPVWSGMKRAAAALAAVHTAGLETKRRRSIQDELARFRKRAAKIASVDATQGARLDELAAALPAWLPWLDEWGAGLSLIHGDCKPSQFLISDDGRTDSPVAILDFDHAGMADPANDVGTYLATLRQLAVRQSLKSRGDEASVARAEWLLALEKYFLDEYCAAHGGAAHGGAAGDRGEGFRLRAVWYEAVGLLRKALRGFGRSPFSPLPGAMVAEAWRCLAELPSAGLGTNTRGDGR